MSKITVTCTDLPEPKWTTVDLTQPGIIVCRAHIADHLPQIMHYGSLLSEDEMHRARQYHQDKDRNRFIISRGLLRMLLAKQLELLPEAIMFGRTAAKKPFVINASTRVVEFNVTHAGEWILIALAHQLIGVDVEYVDDKFLFDDIVTQVFAESEREFVYTSALPLQSFYTIWSRKECLLKGSGKGIGENLRAAVCVTGTNQLDGSVIGSEVNWLVQTFAVTDKYVGNIAYTKLSPINFFHITPGAL